MQDRPRVEWLKIVFIPLLRFHTSELSVKFKTMMSVFFPVWIWQSWKERCAILSELKQSLYILFKISWIYNGRVVDIGDRTFVNINSVYLEIISDSKFYELIDHRKLVWWRFEGWNWTLPYGFHLLLPVPVVTVTTMSFGFEC